MVVQIVQIVDMFMVGRLGAIALAQLAIALIVSLTGD